MDQPTPPVTPVTPEPALYIPPVRPTLPTTSNSPQLSLHPKKKSKAGLIVGLIVGLILVLAGGTYAAARYGYITLPFPLPGIANDVIAKSLDALYNTTASESTSEFSIKIAPRDSSVPTLFPANSTTSSDNSNSGLGLGNSSLSSAGSMLELVPDNLAIAGSTTSYSEKTNEVGKVDATMRLDATFGDTKVVADLAMRLLEKNMYLKINVLEGIPNVDATSVVGKWYTTNLNDAASLIPTNTNTSDEELQKSRKTVQDVLTLAQKYQLFTTKKNFGAETIEGVKTRHTGHALNPKQVAPFFEALIPVMKAAGQDTAGSDEMLAELKKPETHATLENISKALTLDLWYDGKGKIMKKMAMTMIVVPPASSVKYKASQFVLSFSTTLKSFGKTKNLETPTDAEPLESLMTSILSSGSTDGGTESLSDAQKKARDEQRKSNISQLRTALTLYYDDHSAYPTRLEDLAPTYIDTLPTDPTTKGNYAYLFCDKNHFVLRSILEETNRVYFSSSLTFDGAASTSTINSGEATGTVSCEGISGYIADDTTTNANTSTNVNTNSDDSVSSDDTDHDKVSDALEISIYHSDPTKADTDGDKLSDYEEIQGWTTKYDATRPDLQTELFQTDVTKADTDNDGFSDLDELCHGYSPAGSAKILLPLSRRPENCST